MSVCRVRMCVCLLVRRVCVCLFMCMVCVVCVSVGVCGMWVCLLVCVCVSVGKCVCVCWCVGYVCVCALINVMARGWHRLSSSVILSCTESYKYWLWSKLLGLACLCNPCPHGCWGFELRSLWWCGRWFTTGLPFPRLQTLMVPVLGSISLLESERWWWPGIFLSPHAEEFLRSFCCLLFIRLG